MSIIWYRLSFHGALFWNANSPYLSPISCPIESLIDIPLLNDVNDANKGLFKRANWTYCSNDLKSYVKNAQTVVSQTSLSTDHEDRTCAAITIKTIKTFRHLRKLFVGNYLKIWTVWFYQSVMCPKGADGLANSADPDWTAQEQSDLGLHCLSRLIC